MTQQTTINDYANNMFRYDKINRNWLERCAAYLRTVFGACLENAVVLDYAFGRGNWAIAFRMAGAKRVLAVDASEDNVRRLSDWCNANAFDGIDVIHGNALEQPLNAQVDILWIYGILPLVDNPFALLDALLPLARDNKSLACLYAYDQDSMRHWLVETARSHVLYDSEEAFRHEAPLYSHHARLRVRDDLTAPVLHWFTAAAFGAMVEERGWSVRRSVQDFGEWLKKGRGDEEFQPHLLLCGNSPGEGDPRALEEPLRPQAYDLSILRALGKSLFAPSEGGEVCRKRVIGLCNTHFDSLAVGGMEAAVLNDFLFMLYLFLDSDKALRGLDKTARAMVQLAMKAMDDSSRNASTVADSPLARYLVKNTIRL